MIARCHYCVQPIKDGQRHVYYPKTGAVYHLPCDVRRQRMAEGAVPEGKYGEITAEKKKFHPGEPVFLIRGTDPYAVHAIVDYARRCQEQGAAAEHVNDCFDHAMRMGEWQRENPELVKPLPD